MKQISTFLLLSISLWAYNQTSAFNIQGHRGARGLYPENTIRGFIEALKMGANTIELDVVITSDSQVIVSHDWWIGNHICNNVTKNKSKFNIYKMTYREVQQYDCGSKHHKRFPEQEKFHAYKPLLSEVFDSIEAFSVRANIVLPHYNIEIKSTKKGDNKHHPEPELFTSLVYQVIKEKNVAQRSYIQSFDVRILHTLKELNCFMPQALLSVNIGGAKSSLNKLKFAPTIYSPLYLLTSKSTVKKCHQLGIKVIPWTVNKRKKMKRMKAIGCDGVITDYPNIAVQELR